MLPSSIALHKWLRNVTSSPLHGILVAAYFYTDSWLILAVTALAAFDAARQFLSLPRPVVKPDQHRIIIVGAGASGLCMAKRLKDVGIEDFVILEKSPDLGGTWLQNRYPGVACDITSHNYCYSFHYNPGWTRSFSGGKEIWHYFKDFSQYYALDKFIQFNTRVEEAVWNATNKIWKVQAVKVDTGDKVSFSGNIFIGATGALCIPSWPRFKNEDKFKRSIIHANDFWSLDSSKMEGKNVGIVGTGATAVQIVPAIADKVNTLHLFQRTPAWAIYRRNLHYFNWLKHALKLFPFLITAFRYLNFIMAEIAFQLFFFLDRITHVWAARFMAKNIKGLLKGDEELSRKLIPTYEIGCKRITPSQDYIKSFLRENVRLITSEIDSFTENGISTADKREFSLDLIILATGFDLLANAKPFLTYNDGKKNCQEEEWKDEPRAYLGVTHPGYPNKFNLLGPGSGLGHSSIIFVIECQVNYVLDCIRSLSSKPDKKSMELKGFVFDDFLKYLNHSMKNKAFNGSCSAWYKNARGVNWTLWPNDLFSYWYYTYSCSEDEYIFD